MHGCSFVSWLLLHGRSSASWLLLHGCSFVSRQLLDGFSFVSRRLLQSFSSVSWPFFENPFRFTGLNRRQLFSPAFFKILLIIVRPNIAVKKIHPSGRECSRTWLRDAPECARIDFLGGPHVCIASREKIEIHALQGCLERFRE